MEIKIPRGNYSKKCKQVVREIDFILQTGMPNELKLILIKNSIDLAKDDSVGFAKFGEIECKEYEKALEDIDNA